jgi:hypothetical protein
MSQSKREWEEEDADSDPFARCDICMAFKDECICPDVATEGHLFLPGDEGALIQAIDSYVTRTPPHPLDGDEISDEAFFAPWAEAMVRAEVSRGMLEGMWDRIKIKLDDLGKVEQLIADVWGHRTWMVDR